MSWEHPFLDAETTAAVKELLLRTEHLRLPFGEPQALPDDLQAEAEQLAADENAANIPLTKEAVAALEAMPFDDPAMKAAIKSYQHFMVLNLEPLVSKHHTERRSAAPKIDGIIGPATLELFGQPRCGMADYAFAEEVTGSGQWRSCHNIGDFHSAIVKLMNKPPAHLLRPYEGGTVWDYVKGLVRKAYAEIGLRLWFSDDANVPEGNYQTGLTWVDRSAGWIGLALIGQGQQCSSNPIWLRLLSTYLRSSAITKKYLTLQGNLLAHELAHNCGSGHTSGGILNPSILSVDTRWIGDPAESRMKVWFGGEPVPLDDDEPPPDDPPPPDPFPGGWTGSLTNASSGQSIKLLGLPS